MYALIFISIGPKRILSQVERVVKQVSVNNFLCFFIFLFFGTEFR